MTHEALTNHTHLLSNLQVQILMSEMSVDLTNKIFAVPRQFSV